MWPIILNEDGSGTFFGRSLKILLELIFIILPFSVTTDGIGWSGNNIAIFKLRTRIQYNNCKQPACLEPQRTSATSALDVPEVDDTCIMASVGDTSNNNSEPPNIPQQAHIKLYSRQLTEAIVQYVYPQFLPDGVVIGRPENPSVQTCLSDWGGIVVCRRSNKWWLRGIISTNNCLVSKGGVATPEPPIFITEVANYKQWIDTCLNNIDSCPTRRV
ncbi:chymotrypsin A-like [Haliotis rubra]|uniref:chymotrypsin A-like n=1 Tax=Haliotis rubra TaxID=36100 RepID=UPI001EE5119B|nr:chymotrypsin A-like [Haliotis rubra]